MIIFYVVGFSECRSEEVISFFWCSVYYHTLVNEMLLLRDLDRIQVNSIAISSTHLDLAYNTCLFPIKIPKYLVAISYWKACYDRKHLRIPDATLIQTRQKYPEIVVHSYTEREDFMNGKAQKREAVLFLSQTMFISRDPIVLIAIALSNSYQIHVRLVSQ